MSFAGIYARGRRVEKRGEDERADELKKLVNARGDPDILEREFRDCIVYATVRTSRRIDFALHKHTHTRVRPHYERIFREASSAPAGEESTTIVASRVSVMERIR